MSSSNTSFSRCLVDVLQSSDDDESDSGASPSSTKKGENESQKSIVPSRSSQSSNSSSSSFRLSRFHNKFSSSNNQSKKSPAPKKGPSATASTSLRREARQSRSLGLELSSDSSSSSSSSDFSDLETKKKINRPSPASRRKLRNKAQPAKQKIKYSCSSSSESSHLDSSESESDSNSGTSRDLRSKRARARDLKIAAKEAKARKAGTLVGSTKLRGIDPSLVDESSESEDYFQPPAACLNIQTRPIATKRNRSSKECTSTKKNDSKFSTADKSKATKPLATVKPNVPPQPTQRKPPVQPPKKGSQQRNATGTDDDESSISSDESTNLERMARKCSIQKSLYKSPVYSPSNMLMFSHDKRGRRVPTSSSSTKNGMKSSRSIVDGDDALDNDDIDDTDNSSVETTKLVERLKKKTQGQTKNFTPTNPRETRADESNSPQAQARNEANNDRGSLQRNDSHRNDKSNVDVESISSTGSSMNGNKADADTDVDIDSVDTAELNQRLRRNLGLPTSQPASKEAHPGPTPKKNVNDQVPETDNINTQENDKDEFILPACDSSSSESSASEGGLRPEDQEGREEKWATVPSTIQLPCAGQTNAAAVQSTEQQIASTTAKRSDREANIDAIAPSQAASDGQNQSRVQHRAENAAHASPRNVESSRSPSLGNGARPFNPYARSQDANGAQNEDKAQQQPGAVAAHASSRNQEAPGSLALGGAVRPFNPYSRAKVDSSSGGLSTNLHSQPTSQNSAVYQTPERTIDPLVANPETTSQQYQETEQGDVQREVLNQTERYSNDDLEYLEDLPENGDSLPLNTARKASDAQVTRETNHQGDSRENIGREKSIEELEEEAFFSQNDTELRTANVHAENEINHAPDIVDLCDVVDDDEPYVPTHSTIVRQGLRVPTTSAWEPPRTAATAIDDIEYFSDDDYNSPQHPRRVTDVSKQSFRGQVLLATSKGGGLQPAVSSANYGLIAGTAKTGGAASGDPNSASKGTKSQSLPFTRESRPQAWAEQPAKRRRIRDASRSDPLFNVRSAIPKRPSQEHQARSTFSHTRNDSLVPTNDENVFYRQSGNAGSGTNDFDTWWQQHSSKNSSFQSYQQQQPLRNDLVGGSGVGAGSYSLEYGNRGNDYDHDDQDDCASRPSYRGRQRSTAARGRARRPTSRSKGGKTTKRGKSKGRRGWGGKRGGRGGFKRSSGGGRGGGRRAGTIMEATADPLLQHIGGADITF